MHSQSKYQANDSQLLTNQEQEEEEEESSSSEEIDEEEEHYAFWLWEMFNKRD